MGYLKFMKKILENIANMDRKLKHILIVLIAILSLAWLYFYHTNYYIVVRFDELGPVSKNMSAYYNGFKVGKIVSIEPDKDFKHTLVKVNLSRRNINLPQNTTVKLETFPNGALYLQFIYPESPSLRIIKRGDIVEGISPYNLEQFMLGQNISGISDIVSIYVIKALNATEIANLEMKNFFQNTSELVKDNHEAITASVNNTAAMTKSLAEMAENLNQTSKNLNLATKNLNNAFDEKTLKSTTSNIKDATSNIKDAATNIKDTTANISNATKDMDKTMNKIDSTVSNLNATAENLNCITTGINNTLSKRAGGMRVLFGTPVK